VPSELKPVVEFTPELHLKAQSIRIAFFDVDGVLTDGGLYYDASGECLKRFNALDGLGLKLLNKAGIVPVVISGRESPALRMRLTDLRIAHFQLGAERKLEVAESFLRQFSLTWSEAAVIGDDWPDIPMMARSKLACATPAAHAQVKQLADYVTRSEGGHGAAREFCDLLLVASGNYARLLRAVQDSPSSG
jgi:3-deoxy-D-manno-octulosonate 8-phosphate phosphatase (KDO 8-P phosphatase)